MAHQPRPAPCQEDATLHAFMAGSPAEQVAFLTGWGLDPAVAVVLVNTCANRCFFCAQPGTIAVPASDVTPWARVEGQLGGARPAGVDRLMIGGNEPTLHPDFERLMAAAPAAGFTSIDLMTSGLALADPVRLDRWVAHGLRRVAVPLYAEAAPLHDAVCGAVCFDRTVAGLDAAHARGVTVHVHTLALRRNLDVLAPLARMVADRWEGTLAIAPLREKAGLFVWDDEALPLAAVRAWLGAQPADLPVTLLGWPTCVDRARPRGSAQVIEMYFRTQLRRFAPACEGCADRADCLGVVQAMLDRLAPGDLVPRA